MTTTQPTLEQLLAPIRARIPDTNDLSRHERDRETILAALDAVVAVAVELEANAQRALVSAQNAEDDADMYALDAEAEACREAAKDIRQAVHTALAKGGE